MVIAYEPIWAIGTGKTATAEQAGEVCAHIRAIIRKLYGARVARAVTIQYGGSMNAKNAAELLCPARRGRRPDRRRFPEARRLPGDHQRRKSGIMLSVGSSRIFMEKALSMKTPDYFDHYGRLRPAATTMPEGNAIANAKTPHSGSGCFQRTPCCRLSASGLDVGLPEGQMGNSEVGHTNIGAGRVVFQDLPRICTGHRRRAVLPERRLCVRHGRLQGKGHCPASAWACSATAASIPISTHLFALLEHGQGAGTHPGLRPLLPGRAGRAAHLRQGLCGAACRPSCAGAGRGQDRHGHGAVLRHGPGQAAGSGWSGPMTLWYTLTLPFEDDPAAAVAAVL